MKLFIIKNTPEGALRLILRKMKCVLFFLILVTGCWAAETTYAQQTEIRLESGSRTLGDVFDEIERKSEFIFFYNDNVVDLSTVVKLEGQKLHIREILDKVLDGNAVEYTIIDRQVVLTRKAQTLVAEALAAEPEQTGRRITGTVVDSQGEPVIGANVIEKGTANGSATDLNGDFVLTVQNNAVLQVSYIGYLTQDVTVGSRANLQITLIEDNAALEEVVVIGYGTVKKSDLTGAIVSISEKKFRDLPQGDVSTILQGKAAGVNIQSTSGAGDKNIRIRGITSLNKSSDPLWVVDGVIGGTVGNFYDIQSIEVLKDASSTAIYGSQGANGVILVTTKRGVEGKPQITLDARFGWSNLLKKPDLLSPYEYAKAYNELKSGSFSDQQLSEFQSGAKGLDWLDLMTQQGQYQGYNLSIRGGSQATKYTVSASVGDNTGMVITDHSRTYNAKITLDMDLAPWLTLSTYTAGSYGNSHNGSGHDSFMDIMEYSPVIELQLPDGTYNTDMYGSLGTSPYGSKYAKYSDREENVLTAFADLKIKIIDGLTFSVQGLYNHTDNASRSFSSSKLYPSAPTSASNTAERYYSWRNIDNLTYQKELGDHRFTVSGVFEATKYEKTALNGTARGLSNEDLGYWNLAASDTKETSNSYTNSAMTSVFGRVIYSYRNKYSFTGTYRADAASQFRDKYKWGYFPSAGVAWNIHEEGFVNKDVLQQLKMRATVGVTGNHGIGAYSTMGRLSLTNASYGLDKLFPGFWQNEFTNKDLHWEKTTQYDLGLDFAILDQRLNATIDWYLKKTTDLLFEKNLPLYNGGGKIWTNQGAMDNTGWEFTVNAFPVTTKNLRYETNLTATYTKNTIKDLAGEEFIIPDATRGGLLRPYLAMVPGMPVGVFYLFDYVGIDENGNNLYRTKDGSTTNTPSDNDRIFIGNPTPKWIFGWNNQLNWKNWDLNVFLRATSNYDRLNLSRFVETAPVSGSNFISTREAYYYCWDIVADKSQARFPSIKSSNNQSVSCSTQWLEHTSFLRMQNVTLGYTLPKKVTKFTDLHLSLSADNLFVISGYHGLDPETISEVGDTYRDAAFGVDKGSYPLPRTFTFILRFDF